MNISQGSVVTHFRCDGIFNDIVIANFQEIVKVKKMKIGQYLMKLCLKYYWLIVFPDTVYIWINSSNFSSKLVRKMNSPAQPWRVAGNSCNSCNVECDNCSFFHWPTALILDVILLCVTVCCFVENVVYNCCTATRCSSCCCTDGPSFRLSTFCRLCSMFLRLHTSSSRCLSLRPVRTEMVSNLKHADRMRPRTQYLGNPLNPAGADLERAQGRTQWPAETVRLVGLPMSIVILAYYNYFVQNSRAASLFGCNSACAGDTPQMLAPTWGSGWDNLMVSVKLCSDDPCYHGNENLKMLTKNSPYLDFCITDKSSILDQIAYGLFGGHRI